MVKVLGLDHAPQAPKEPPVPFLDARALDTDPDGMAFLRAVIRPEPAVPSPGKEPQPFAIVSQGDPDSPKPPVRSDAAVVAPAG
jgi:hypothetical protein